MAWWQYALIGGFILAFALMARVFYVFGRRPHCPRCYYPLHRCECNEQIMERSLRRVEG